MVITNNFDRDEFSAVLITYEGQWTWDEHRAAIRDASVLIRSTDSLVHLIIDVRESSTPPRGAISCIGEAFKETPDNWSRTAVFVSSHRLTTVLMEMVSKVYGRFVKNHTYLFVASLEEAWALLANMKPQLDSHDSARC